MPGPDSHRRASQLAGALGERIGQVDEAQRVRQQRAIASLTSATGQAARGPAPEALHRRPSARPVSGAASPARRSRRALISLGPPWPWCRGRAAGAGERRNSAYGRCPRWPAPWPSRPSAPIVVGIDADDVEPIEVAEFGPAQLLQLATENQMQKLFLSVFRGHVCPSTIVNFAEV